MYSKQWALCLVGGLTVMTVIGCYSHYPSSVYGPGGVPGTYGAPPGGAYPQGGSYVLPPGSPAQGSGTSLAPGNTYESRSPSADGSTNRWQPGGTGGNAPAFDPAKDGVTPGGSNRPVPDYKDPNGSGGASAQPFNDTNDFRDTNDFDVEAPASKAPSGAADPVSPFESGDTNTSPFDGSASNSNGDVPFDEETPFVAPAIPLMPVASIRDVDDSPAVAVAAPNPYKYDRKTFRWLRGVVDYDNEARSWNIIYNIEPDRQDQFGGSIVLQGTDQFEALQNDDVVLVEGGVDTKRLDAFGKPMFRVDHLVRLEPIN